MSKFKGFRSESEGPRVNGSVSEGSNGIELLIEQLVEQLAELGEHRINSTNQ